jgi:hypothetical protein
MTRHLSLVLAAFGTTVAAHNLSRASAIISSVGGFPAMRTRSACLNLAE